MQKKRHQQNKNLLNSQLDKMTTRYACLLLSAFLGGGMYTNPAPVNANESAAPPPKPSAQSAAIPDWSDIDARTDRKTDAKNTATDDTGMGTKFGDKSRAKPLVGRVEQLSRESTPLPPNSEFKDALNTNIQKSARQVETFPKSYVGKWSGKVNIEQNDYGVLKVRDPKMFVRESNIMYKGRAGMGEVFFELIGDTVQALAPVADFAPQSRDRKFLDLVRGKISPGTHFNVRFRDRTNRTTITGTEASYRVTLDRLTALDNNVYEEQIATISNVIDTVKRGVSYGSAETVLQFHLLDSTHMEVTMVSVHYASDRALESKLFIHGVFQRQTR